MKKLIVSWSTARFDFKLVYVRDGKSRFCPRRATAKQRDILEWLRLTYGDTARAIPCHDGQNLRLASFYRGIDGQTHVERTKIAANQGAIKQWLS